MPKTQVKLPYQVERLSVLDSNGKLDAELEPDLSKEQLKKLHRAMRLSRRFDEQLLSLQRKGKIGTFAPVKGQEASQLGAVAALNDDDWMIPSFREIAAIIWRGTPLWGIFLHNAGYNEGGRIPEGQNDLPIAVPVASQIPHAAGIAYAMKYRKAGAVAMTFFGDGATSEGDFHEALNFGGVFRLPAVFVCENNQWAISVPREKQTKSKTIAQKALAYGIPGVQVDGNDILAVYRAARQAVDRARSGEGPTLIECETYRLSVHTTADDPTKYRSKEEVEQWEERDPLPRFEKYLTKKKVLKKADIEKIDEEVQAGIDEAWEETQRKIKELDGPSVIFDHVYAETPPYLAEQRDAFEKSLGKKEGS